MDSLVKARGDADIITGTFDLSGTRTLLDVGPGPGTYALHLCRKYPGLRVTLFDLPATLEISKEFVKDSGLVDRVELIAGDYRVDHIPGRYQAIFLSNIIHGEGENENGRLMAKLFLSLEPAGRIIIKDHILNDARTGPPVGALFSMLMLLTTFKGRCYSFSEVSQWLEGAGFKRIEQRPLPPPLTSSLVIGQKD
jgi:cyclopropane fatty-acyl-phospholipid synthase-like methyltransferase